MTREQLKQMNPHMSDSQLNQLMAIYSQAAPISNGHPPSAIPPIQSSNQPMASNSPWMPASSPNPQNSLSPLVNSVNGATANGTGVVSQPSQNGPMANALLMKLLGNIPATMKNQ